MDDIEREIGLKACDWRVMISPYCSHYSELKTINEASFGSSIFMALFCLIVLFLRVFYFKQKFLRPPTDSAPGWFWMDTTNALVFAYMVHFLAKIVVTAILIFSNPPYYITHALFDFTYVIGFISTQYFLLGLVLAIPISNLKDTQFLDRLIRLLRRAVPSLSLLAMCMPILFGISAYYIYVDSKINRVFETVLYSMWASMVLIALLSVIYSSSKLFKIIESSIKFNKTKEDGRLIKILFQIKVSVMAINGMYGFTMGSLILLAALRQTFWGIPVLNILACGAYHFFTTITSIPHLAFLLARDGRFKLAKDKKDESKTKNSIKSSNDVVVNVDVKPSKAKTAEDVVMDEFLSSHERE